ncbi:MAG: hypothetical protein FWG57_01000 [Endomicrobia bacterium]|nr:hypothetical protein [Endomicrobiia bacterium]
MAKKLFFALFGLIYFSGFAFAGFGVNLRGGKLFGDSIFDKYDEHNYYIVDGGQDYKANFINYGADIFFEKRISNEIFGLDGYGYLGAKVGYTIYEESYYRLHTQLLGGNKFNFTSTAYAVPIMIYYNYEDEDNEHWRFGGGLGIVFLHSEYTYKSSGFVFQDFDEKDSRLSVMPRLELGVEYTLVKRMSLFLNLGYQFNGKIETDFKPLDEKLWIDYSGITIDIGIKFNLIRNNE